ncbi:thioredoxin [Nanoarchaeota archaeon]
MNEITSENFEKEVLKSDKPVIVDFWAPWCGPCMAFAPTFEKVSEKNKNIKFCKLNIDESRDIAQKFNVMAIPCIVTFKDGNEVDRVVGSVSEEKLQELSDKL